MLQQTQVKTVIPYWERWMRALPDIPSLAHADAATIHKLWEGLGYYTRVRNMQKAAREILARHHGEFPRTHAAILELPGIGPYTAGAIASIAFDQPAPILDGNVIRVLTRLFAIPENPLEKTTNKKLWRLAQQLVTASLSRGAHAPSRVVIGALANHSGPHASPSALNQSLMELGALICTPKQPKCPSCPVAKNCRAHRLGQVEQFPNLAKRAAATQRHFIAFVIRNRGRYLVRQRPAGVVNAHLWEFPNIEIPALNHADTHLLKLAHDYLPRALQSTWVARATRSSRRATDPAEDREQRLDGDVIEPNSVLPIPAGESPTGTGGSPVLPKLNALRLTNLQPFCTIKHTITRYRITLEVMIADCRFRIADSGKETECWLKPAELHLLPFTSAHKKILRQLTKE